MLSTHMAKLKAFARVRSSRQALGRVTTPVFMFQGRPDFAFDLQQAKNAMKLLRGPHRLYIGNFGHAPSTFPGPDVVPMMTRARLWFDQYLKGANDGMPSGWFDIASNPFRGNTLMPRLPKTHLAATSLRGRRTIGASGRIVRTGGPLRRRIETFGSGTVRAIVRLRGGWQRVVAVVTAKPRHGSEIVVTEGGVNTRGLRGRHRLAIHLIDQATLIPAGSRLRVYLADTSMDQSSANLLYLDLPEPRGAKLTVERMKLSLRVLRHPISR
jgi:hypothetical protein